MSELINDNRTSIRWKLLTGASALALTAYTSSLGFARAEDTGRPTVWIEVGGQLSALLDNQETFAPQLMEGRPSIFESSQKFEKPPGRSLDETGSISFQPDNSDWVFSASAQFGRSKSSKHNVQQTNPLPTSKYYGGNRYTIYPIAQKFADTKASNSEQHTILDFQVGKDVGLGLFKGHDGSSLISFGARFAQFSRASNISAKSDPDWHFVSKYFYNAKIIRQAFHSNLASMTAQRNFHGIGPSVSWNSSVPVVGNLEGGQITADWGINGAVLFGRQKTQTHHQSTARYHAGTSHAPQVPGTISRFPQTPDHMRSHSVIVPNLGGFAGLSVKYPNAKVSFGYKADFFFGAIDGGIDVRRTEDVGFHGPFATVSVGLGG